MKNYKIGIVGYGVVGQGIHKLFKEDVVAIYDPAYEKSNLREDFGDVDIVVVSVPTNETEDWSANTSILFETFSWLRLQIRKDAIILVKSTTPPEVIRRLKKDYWTHTVFSPEYMGESKYYTPPWKYPHPTDMESHTWQIFGGDKCDTSLCVDAFKRRMGVDCQYWQTDIVTASLTKYIENSFFAMKVTFVNEWYDIAQTYGVDWNELRELWLLDPRINRNHTLVFPKDRGYGGKCFPKDTRAIIKATEDKGYSPKLMRAMDEVNQFMRKKNG